MRRALIAAGGTGGHFYPGLVAARALKARGWQPLIAVKKDDPAKTRLESEGLALIEVDLRGLPRKPGAALLVFSAGLFASLGLLCRVARDFRPNLVLGMGGYLTFPAAFAAWRRGVPCALHESNSILGLANAAAVKLGAALFWGLPPAGGKGTVVGTPVRPELHRHLDPAASRRALGLDSQRATVLVFGGSQGAQALNTGLGTAVKRSGVSPQILHLAGRKKSEETLAAYKNAGTTATVFDYLDNMAAAYGAADIVICRAGAGTLAELAAQRKPAILIPYPHAAAGHQDANARVFERAGAALRISEEGLAEKLGPALADLLKSKEAAARRAQMSNAYKSLGLPSAEKTTEMFVDILERLCPE